MRRSCGCFCVFALAAQVTFAEETTQELKTKADDVLRQTNVSARAEVDVVFRLVDRLIAEKKLAEAEAYLSEALKLFPWNLGYQMRYAELLSQRGDAQKAKERAALVLANCETDELTDRARTMLGQERPADFPALGALPGTNCCVVIVPLQGCDRWLAGCLQTALANALHISVHVQTAKLVDVAPQRDLRQKIIARMRQQLKQGLEEPAVSEAMVKLGLKAQDLDDDNQVVKLMRHLLQKESDKDAEKKLVAFLQDARGKDPQWDAERLLNELCKAVAPCRRENVAYVGLTPDDIYAKDSNYLFGLSGARGAIISYRRFTADFNREVPKRERLLKRTLMQGLSSVGLIYGIERCSDPTCARAYPHSLSEHDAKTGTLCSECSAKFKARLGL